MESPSLFDEETMNTGGGAENVAAPPPRSKAKAAAARKRKIVLDDEAETPEEDEMEPLKPKKGKAASGGKKPAKTKKRKDAEPVPVAEPPPQQLIHPEDLAQAEQLADEEAANQAYKPPEQILPAPPGKDFVVRIPYPQPFKTMIEIMAHVLVDCHFKVEATPTFCGLCVESVDESKVCLINARFACEAAVAGGVPQTFCVKMAVLNALLKSVAAGVCITLSRNVGEAEVHMTADKPGSQAHYQEFTIRTLDREYEECSVGNLSGNFTIEIDLTEFRGLVKMAKELKADDLTFEIMEPLKRGDVRLSYFIISVKGDAECRNVYTSATEWKTGDDQSVIIKTVEQGADSCVKMPDPGKMRQCMHEKFSIAYLTNFLASLKQASLTIQLSSEGDPMMMRHPLGGDSHISFVLAPKLKDEDAARPSADPEDDAVDE